MLIVLGCEPGLKAKLLKIGKCYLKLLQKRCQGQPVAYLTGSRGFWSMDLSVSPDTLIPRPETELLVEIALQLKLPKHSRGLDLGTGTGAIALALISERKNVR